MYMFNGRGSSLGKDKQKEMYVILLNQFLHLKPESFYTEFQG